MNLRTKRICSVILSFLLIITGLYIPENVSGKETGSDPVISANDILAAQENAYTEDDAAFEDEALDAQDATASVSGNTSDSYTIVFVDDDAHGNATLIPETSYPSGKTLRKQCPAAAGNMIRHGYKIKCWHVYRDINGRYEEDESSPVKASQFTKSSENPYKFNTNYRLVAEWNTTPVDFAIEYHYNGGFHKTTDKNAGLVATKFTVEDQGVTLHAPVKAGSLFGGWFEDEALTKPITAIPAGTFFDSDADGNVASYHVYAKWIGSQAGIPVVKGVTSSGTGTAILNFNGVDAAQCYEIAFSTSNKFPAKKTSYFTVAKAGRAKITNLLKKQYFFKVRAYTADSLNARCCGGWSDTVSVKISKGVKEVKAKKGKIRIKSVKVKNGMLSAQVKSPKRLKSSDASYYLVTVDPASGKIEKKIAVLPKMKSVTVTLPLTEEDGTNLIYGKYGVAIKKGKKYKLMSNCAFISNPEAAATYTEPFPTALSKKGLQGSNSGNVKHIFNNYMLNSFFDVGKNDYNAYTYNGTTYYFNKYAMQGLINWVSSCNKEGLVCTAQFMLQWPGGEYSYLVAPGAREGGHAYYTLNGTEKKARKTWEALFNYMGENLAAANCHLDNWILGNEVNVGNEGPGWYYHGSMSMNTMLKHYEATYRTMYYAVRSHSKNSRVYICTDHTFNDWDGGWGAKPFMDQFNKLIKKDNKKINWNLAYHAYPSILTKSDTWNDDYTSSNTSSTFVTPKNLEVLTKYVKKNFGKNTRIILSEQGFTASSGSDVQAAAVAYTYYKAEFNDMIDAVIFRAITDDPTEAAQGLLLGLQNRPGTWRVFTNMDSPDSTKYTNPYLHVIGNAKSWSSLIKGWDKSKFAKMK
ncbi:MAG: InlB B-repeat-containing protein [Lachnospiraceae bacterium]|nr:InlB B-repeat-containing protein [Lachnospiraceae bacterium]